MEITWEIMVGIGGGVGTLATAYIAVRNIIASKKQEKEQEAAAILQEAKEYTESVRKDLEVKINEVQNNLTVFEESVNKDLQHLRETYNGEIRNLGQKIEELRGELRNQHGQLVSLLTKMIGKKPD